MKASLSSYRNKMQEYENVMAPEFIINDYKKRIEGLESEIEKICESEKRLGEVAKKIVPQDIEDVTINSNVTIQSIEDIMSKITGLDELSPKVPDNDELEGEEPEN